MFRLVVDLDTSAQLLGMEPEAFLRFVEREKLAGIIKSNDHWQVSVFTLAQLLNTTPTTLLELIEDFELGRRIKEVEEDEQFDPEEGWQVYQQSLAEANG